MRWTRHCNIAIGLSTKVQETNCVIYGFDNYETITWKYTTRQVCIKTCQTFVWFIFPGSVLEFAEILSLELHSCDIISLGKAAPPCAFRRTQKQWSASVSTCKMKLSTEMPHCNKQISCTSSIYIHAGVQIRNHLNKMTTEILSPPFLLI